MASHVLAQITATAFQFTVKKPDAFRKALAYDLYAASILIFQKNANIFSVGINMR